MSDTPGVIPWDTPYEKCHWGVSGEPQPVPSLLWVRIKHSQPRSSQVSHGQTQGSPAAVALPSLHILSQTPLQEQLSEQICWLGQCQVPAPGDDGCAPHTGMCTPGISHHLISLCWVFHPLAPLCSLLGLWGSKGAGSQLD